MTRGRGKDAVSVLVVGGGPVGLALASDLGWRGIDCLLIEQSEYSRDYFQDSGYRTRLGGYEFGREPFPSLAGERPLPTSPQKRERSPQSFFDPVLRAFGARQPGVELRYRTQLKSFRLMDECVVATRPGSRAPHVWLADGYSTLDLFGRSFVLLAWVDSARCRTARHGGAAATCSLEAIAIDEPMVAAAYGRRLVLVRPDGHIAWRGNDFADPQALLDTVRGFGAPAGLVSIQEVPSRQTARLQ